MKFYVFLVFLAFLSLWILSLALFSGMIPTSWLPESLTTLELPTSFALLGESMTTLDGLFSSIAIVLGLIAILFQGTELKASTDAQRLQSEALTKQIAQQEESNRLGAYSARLQFLSAEVEHLEVKINDMVNRTQGHKENGEDQKTTELWNIIKATRKKQQRYREQAENIDRQIQQYFNQL